MPFLMFYPNANHQHFAWLVMRWIHTLSGWKENVLNYEIKLNEWINFSFYWISEEVRHSDCVILLNYGDSACICLIVVKIVYCLARHRLPGMGLLRESPADGEITRQVKHAANVLDRFRLYAYKHKFSIRNVSSIV